MTSKSVIVKINDAPPLSQLQFSLTPNRTNTVSLDIVKTQTFLP